MGKTKVILASGSPRRKEILQLIGVNFEVVVSNEEEKPTSTNPLDFPKENASIKALAVSRKMPSEIVLGWRLTHLNGVEIFDDTELFIEFDNAKLDNGKESHRYKMLDNIGSMYPRLTTGSYSLVTEEDGSYTISGSYDNGSGDWNEEYRVALFLWNEHSRQ